MGQSLESGLKWKGIRYWIGAGLVLVASYFAMPYLDEYLGVSQLRYRYFQTLIELSPRPITPRNVKLVLVRDDEYWLGELAGRRPIKRNYVAKLLEAVDAGSPRLIAVDFDVRLQNPKSLTIPSDYLPESEVLARTIVQIAERRPIVLGISFNRTAEGERVIDPNLYQVFGICSRVTSDGMWIHDGADGFPISDKAKRNLSCGYIEFPPDLRVIPPRLQLVDGGLLDSFSLAIARRKDEELARVSGGAVTFVSYIKKDVLAEETTTLSAQAVRERSSEALEALNSGIVIVGGDWSSFAAGRGPPIDSQMTPVGRITGAMIHANYVEAILDNRTYPRVSPLAIKIAELVVGALAAIFFALWTTIAWQFIAVLVLTVVLVFAQWTLVHLFGVFFETFIPVLAVWLHSFLEPWFARITGEDEHDAKPKGEKR